MRMKSIKLGFLIFRKAHQILKVSAKNFLQPSIRPTETMGNLFSAKELLKIGRAYKHNIKIAT